MRKIIVWLFLVCLVLPLAAEERKHIFEVGYETSDYTYREPDLMSLKAKKHGVSVVYTRNSALSSDVNDDDPTFASLEYRYMKGRADYNGGFRVYDPMTDTITDYPYSEKQKDYYMEAALKFGRYYKLVDSLKLWPYIGIAWRSLRNSEDKVVEFAPSMFGWTYQRTSTYVYMPIGGRLTMDMGSHIRLTLGGEIDWLIRGNQNSHIRGGNFDSLSNRQEKGYGVRVNAKLETEIWKLGAFIEPFWRYWKIQNSKPVTVYEVDGSGNPTGNTMDFWEPKNYTREYGIRVGITF